MNKGDKPNDRFKEKMKTWFNPNNCFPVVLNVMFFVLYVLCFVSLYKPNLEIIGFGMFFGLHVMMGISMLKTLFQKSGSTETETKKTANIIKKIINFLKDYVLVGKISIAITIILLFVAFIMMIITFRKLRVRHKVHATQPKAAFIPEPDEYRGSTKKTGYEYRGKDKYGKETWKYGYYLTDGVDYFMNDKVTIKMKDKFKQNAISITVFLWVIYFTVVNNEMSEYMWPRFYFILFVIASLPFSILFFMIYNFAKLIGKTENEIFNFFKNFGKFKQYIQLYNSIFINKDNITNTFFNLFNVVTANKKSNENYPTPTIIQFQTIIFCVVMLILSAINIWLAEKIAVRNHAIADPEMKHKHSVSEDDKRVSENRYPEIKTRYELEYINGQKNKCPGGTIKTIDNKNGILECTPDQRMSNNNYKNWPTPPTT